MKHSSVVILGLAAATPAFADLQIKPYGSLRMQVESVSVNQAQAGEDDDYTGLRDAFTRFGVKATYPLTNGTTLGAQIEVPFNTANLKVEDPTYFEDGPGDEDSTARVAKLSADGDWGSAVLGKDWLPYYNHIAYPLYGFSSFYSGWATYARFREYVAGYTTPEIYGIKLTAAALETYPNYDRGAQYALSYQNGGLTFSYAYEDMDSDNDYYPDDHQGAALSYTQGPFYVAVKIEEHIAENGKNHVIKNLYGAYAWQKYTLKGMIAHGDTGYYASGTSYQIGLDYQYTPQFKVFAEYFFEEDNYAILTPDPKDYDPLAGYLARGADGQALVLGLRLDF